MTQILKKILPTLNFARTASLVGYGGASRVQTRQASASPEPLRWERLCPAAYSAHHNPAQGISTHVSHE